MTSSTKHVFVTGGVSSSLGKGITAASLGRLFTSRGLSVGLQKLDPYLNVDPGTMNPYEHGEVFVTDDGGETDLDPGHYERFTSIDLSKASSVSAGAVYQKILQKERRGDYLGKTVQVVPHLTGEIRSAIHKAALGKDILITEVGGTVGDIEILPFLEALRQFRNEVGRNNCFFLHVSLLPTISTGEQKTKPTQHSVTELRSRGIQPDGLVLRAASDVPTHVRSKIADLCDVPLSAVVTAPDVTTVYQIPQLLNSQHLDTTVLSHLGFPPSTLDITDWQAAISRALAAPTYPTVRVAIVGKYTGLSDAYLSVIESVKHAAWALHLNPSIDLHDADEFSPSSLKSYDALIIPGGFGTRGTQGKIATLTQARASNIPTLGICLGLQLMVVEYARSIGLTGANSTELDPQTPHPVITLLDDQARVTDMGGTMRLGAYPATLTSASKVATLYGATTVSERHRHRYEVSPLYRPVLERGGLSISGTSPDGRLVEFIELPSHPFYIATQAHPELKSRPTTPHPLFLGLLSATLS